MCHSIVSIFLEVINTLKLRFTAKKGQQANKKRKMEAWKEIE